MRSAGLPNQCLCQQRKKKCFSQAATIATRRSTTEGSRSLTLRFLEVPCDLAAVGEESGRSVNRVFAARWRPLRRCADMGLVFATVTRRDCLPQSLLPPDLSCPAAKGVAVEGNGACSMGRQRVC